MQDKAKTKEQLIIELKALREQAAESEKGRTASTDPVELRRHAEKWLKARPTETDQCESDDTERLCHELAAHRIELEMQNEELRNASVLIEESRTRLSDLYDFAPVGYLTLDENGLVLEANLTIARELGVERSRLVGSLLSVYIVTADRNAYRSHLGRVLKDKTHQACEVRFMKGSGGDFHALLDTVFIMDAIGKGRLRISVTDITERKQAEEALRKSEDRFQAFMNNSPATAWMKDEHGRYVYLSLPAEMDFGVRAEKCLGKDDFEIFPPERAKKFRKYDLSVLMDDRPNDEIDEYVNADGARRVLWKLRFPLRDASGKRYVGGIGLDVTERRQMEELLQKAHDELELRVRERTTALEKANEELRQIPSKLISVQEEERKRLASELHDSIGQTLAALKFWVEMVLKLRDEGAGSEALNRLEKFVPILQRGIEETRSIYMGLRPPMLDNIGLLATLEWLRHECMKIYPERHIELETGVTEDGIPETLKVNIFRIVQEALNNVAKHSKAEWINISLSKNGDDIELIVSDDGVGMDLEQINQTSTASLGLTSMRERTELTKGRFSIESTPGEGTTIRALWTIETEDQLPKGSIT